MAALSLALWGDPAQAAPGDLDMTFGQGGKVVTEFEGSAYAPALLLQPDGRLVALGSAGFGGAGVFPPDRDFALARYEPDGSLDPSFGTQGQQTADFGGGPSGEGDSAAVGGALQADGKIVAGGTRGHFVGDFALARFNADGSLDPSFGSEGRVVSDLGDNDRILGLALQADGKIVAAGMFGDAAAFARYGPDGSLDPSFGGDGTLTVHVGSPALGVAIQPDGRIVAAGVSKGRFMLVRLQPDGALDESFSGDGVVTTKFGRSAIAGDPALQGDGKIVAAGLAGTGSGRRLDFALARYKPDGRRDRSFSRDGKVTTKLAGQRASAQAVALQADGKIVAAGYSTRGKSFARDFAVARYTPRGRLDRSFSRKGWLLTDMGTRQEIASDIAVAPTGAIVVAGTALRLDIRGDPVFAAMALARYQG